MAFVIGACMQSNRSSTKYALRACIVFTVCEFKCLVRTSWFGRPLNNGKDIPNISKPTEQDGSYTICNVMYYNCLRLMRDWELEKCSKWPGNFRRSVPNGKRGLPLEKNYSSICLSTEISGFSSTLNVQ